MTTLEEIKSKLSVEQLIGEYITLKQSGMNFKGLCPFHQEKTPSFMVSPEKQIWHCFGCNEGGDIFTFIQKHEGIDFKEAIELLARRTGVAIQGFTTTDHSKKQVYYDINEHAVRYYQKLLLSQDPAAVKTREYLAKRAMTPETMEAWGLGFANDTWDGLCKHLQEKKFLLADCVAAGLVIQREGRIYDRFRKRLMFPIRDGQGRTVAFTARTLHRIVYEEEDLGGKYINSPQTQIYNKSQVLYGFDVAKQAIRRVDYAIIVEGNMDVIMSHQAGVQNTVAVSGTALTLDQLKLLKRYSSNIMLSFDADTAGSQAVFRGITLAWDYDMNVKVIVLHEGKDPADIVQKDSELWKEAIRTSIGVVDYYFDAVFARVDLSRSDHKKLAAQKIAGIISRLKTQVEQAHYVQLLAKRLSVPESSVWSLVRQPDREPVRIAPTTPEIKKSAPMRSNFLISFLAQYPEYISKVIYEIEPDMLDVDVQELYKKIIIHYTKARESNLSTLAASLAQTEVHQWSELVFAGEQIYANLSPQQQEHELNQLLKRIKLEYYTVTLHELTESIKRAEAEGEHDRIAQLLEEYQQVQAKRAQA